jgi:hypothetical protein
VPRFGTLDVASAAQDAPQVVSLDAPSWELPDAQLLQVNWEVEDAPALELTPPALHPSIPPYASFVALRYPVSPVGPFTLAQVRLVVRAGIRPRGLCLGAVCDSAAAVDALRSHWGFPVVLGEVSFVTRHDQVRVTAAVDGTEVLELAARDPEVIAGSDLMTFDNLHLVRLEHDGPEDGGQGDGGPGDGTTAAILQVDPEFAVHQADRGRPLARLPDPEALGMRGRLQLRSPIVAFALRADTDLVPPRFRLDPVRPAVVGTTRIQRAA